MKKLLAICMMCVVLVTSMPCVSATGQIFATQFSSAITFNGVTTACFSAIHNNVHYVPLRSVFEMFGASVFYRGQDRQVLALSRDGDLIRHIVGETIITVNGEPKTTEYASVLENGTTYIPLDMVELAFCPDSIAFDNGGLHIQKHFFNNEYHPIVKDVLDLCKTETFYPERYQRYINYHALNPDCSMQDVICMVNMGLDYPFYENVTTIKEPHGLLVLVNKYNQLPAGFSQSNLVEMKREYTIRDGKEYLLSAVAYEAFLQMREAAEKEGLSLLVVSAYRTENYQRNLYNNKVRTAGKVYADNYSARAGFSEHQTGLAVDIGSTKTTFENTAEFRWMQEHGHEYGFILRYPKGKEWLTGYAYEPWHYRYVGADAARVIHEEGLTYEEYCAKYVSLNEFR